MIKTFPLRFDKEFHEKLKKAAHDANKSMHQFILDVVAEAIAKENK